MYQTDTACAWLVCHSQEGLCKLYPPIPGPHFFGGGSQSCDPAAWLGERQLLAGDIEYIQDQNQHQTPFYTHSLNTRIHQSNPLNPPHPHSPSHSPPNSPTYVQSPLSPLQNTPTYNRTYIQLHTLIYLKQHTRPLDVSREGGASASQVERTPGRATLTSWVVGPLHSYTQEGWVDNNNNIAQSVAHLTLTWNGASSSPTPGKVV